MDVFAFPPVAAEGMAGGECLFDRNLKHYLRVPSLPKESLDLVQTARHAVGGQAFHKNMSIVAGHDPCVQNCQDSPVRAAADQPSKALLQGDDSVWHLVLIEWVPT